MPACIRTMGTIIQRCRVRYLSMRPPSRTRQTVRFDGYPDPQSLRKTKSRPIPRQEETILAVTASTFWRTATVDETEFLERLLERLERSSASFCVIGGQAVNAYAAEPRGPLVSVRARRPTTGTDRRIRNRRRRRFRRRRRRSPDRTP